MDWKLETLVVPVADLDGAKAFYADAVGFHVDVDHRAGEDFRVVQLTPTGSGCSISLMKNGQAAGTLQGLHLVVRDIERELIPALEAHGVGVSGRPGDDRCIYFNDPDGHRLQLMFRK